MKRRDFLTTAVGFSHLLAARRVQCAQNKPVRAAVVIGVDKTGDLPVLRAAASGAAVFADFLKSEEFEVHRFVTHPVTVKPIFDAIATLVNRGTLDQLVVYFSGHGFLNNGSEMWMLSGAPDNPNEAVSLRECIDLARESAVPNVVFISDACRSVPSSLRADRVRGSLIFPNAPARSGVGPDVEVDRFLAARPGQAAVELPVDKSSESFEGIFTSSFLDAFTRPEKTMVHTINGVNVVPNRRLKKYLASDVSRRATAKSIRLQQLPQSIIESSSDDTYIGRVSRVSGSLPTPPRPPLRPVVTVSISPVWSFAALGSRLLAPPRSCGRMKIYRKLSDQTGFGEVRKTIDDATGRTSFETQTGFSVNGSKVIRAVSTTGMRAELVNEGDGEREPAIIRMHPQGRPAASVSLRFPDGSGTIVAALFGYIGTLAVDRGRVVSVAYTPSLNNPRWNSADFERVRELRAAVATSIQFGAFHIEGDGDEKQGTLRSSRIKYEPSEESTRHSASTRRMPMRRPGLSIRCVRSVEPCGRT